MIQLFASDLDGTLLTNHTVDQIVQETIRSVRKHGRDFAIVTGRPMYPHQYRAMGLRSMGVYIICMNGARILAPDGTELYKKTIDPAFVRALLQRFPMQTAEFFSADHASVQQAEQDYIDRLIRENAQRAARILPTFLQAASFSVSEETLLQTDLVKIDVRIADTGQRTAFERFLAEQRDHIVNSPFTEDRPGYFELTHADAGKAQALTWLMTHLGLSPEQIAVYGDGPNDCEMLRRFPHSFAPQNACPSAKAAAGTVIGSCTDHAVPAHICNLLTTAEK